MASSEFRLPPKIQLNQGVTKQPYTKSKERNNGQASTKKGQAWTNEEHTEFLKGLKQLGKGRWREISKYFVPSRSPTQVASHAQKFQQRIALKGSAGKRRSRFAAIEQGLFGDTQLGPESSIARAQGLLGLQPDAEGQCLPDVLFRPPFKNMLTISPLTPQPMHAMSRPSAFVAPPKPLYQPAPLKVAPLIIPPDPGPFMAGLLRPLAQKPSPYTEPLVNTLMQEREEFYASNMKAPGPVMPSVGSAFRPAGAYRWGSDGTLQPAGRVFVH